MSILFTARENGPPTQLSFPFCKAMKLGITTVQFNMMCELVEPLDMKDQDALSSLSRTPEKLGTSSWLSRHDSYPVKACAKPRILVFTVDEVKSSHLLQELGSS